MQHLGCKNLSFYLRKEYHITIVLVFLLSVVMEIFEGSINHTINKIGDHVNLNSHINKEDRVRFNMNHVQVSSYIFNEIQQPSS